MIEFNPENSQIVNLIEKIQKQDIFTQLLNIDLTTLNSEFGYEVTNQYKKCLIDRINQKFQKNILYFKILGGKILIISSKQITSEEKKDINLYCEKIINDKRRFVYFNEKIISKNNLTYKQLLEKYIQIEINLSQKRENIQKAISQIKSLSDAKELEDIWEITSKKSNQINIKIEKENIRELLKYTKHSNYLTQSLYAYHKVLQNENILQNTNLIFQNTLTYKIWFEIQELLFQSYKKEKINTMIESRNQNNNSNNNSENINREKRFKIQLEFVSDWFKSSIKSLTPYLNQTQLTQIKDFETQINQLQNQSEEEIKNKTKTLLDQITNFTDTLNINGFQSIPLENLKQNIESLQFIQRQIYLNFNPSDKENWNLLTKTYLNQNFIKTEYPGFIKGDSQSILESIQYLNQNLIKESNHQYLTMGFLEIDFFNAFNSYFFPNDVDKFYNKLLDTIFETANEFIMKYPKLFKTLNIGILGDEFFFTFLNKEILTQKDEKTISVFLKLINRKILQKTKTNLIIKTEKRKIIDLKENELTIRVPLEKTKFFSTTTFEIGKISVSKYLLLNKKVQFQNNSILQFKDIYEFLDQKMKFIKENKIKELKIEDFNLNQVEIKELKKIS